MLTLILGRGKTGKTTRLLQAVSQCPAMGMAQRIIIVPEQLSHETERKLAERCGDTISFPSEVLSFSRLYNRVCSLYGGGARKTLDAGGRLLTARLALGSVVSQLKVFASASGRPEFLSGMLRMIDELKSYELTPHRLMELSMAAEGAFSEKLRELSLILGAYDAVSGQGSLDPRDQLTLLKKMLRQEDYAQGRYFFVDGFTDFSAQELGILRELMGRGKGMTVAILCDSLDSDDPLFAPGRETARRLSQIAKELGVSVAVETAEYRRELPEALTYLQENFHGIPVQKALAASDGIHLFAASDALEECRYAAAILKQYAMNGYRYRDMMVAVSDDTAYGTLMETVCRSMEVPLYRSRKRKILSHPAVSFVLLALEAATQGMETETVLAYLKTGFSSLGDDACDALENYAITWGIRGKKWSRDWVMHPEGYDGRFDDETEAYLAQLNLLRAQAIAPIVELASGIANADNIEEQIMALYRFLEQTELYETLSRQVQELSQGGEQEAAQETAQIWEYLLQSLQQIYGVLGSLQQSGSDLLRVLELTLGAYEVGTIPAALDGVTYGDIAAVRGREPKLLVVLGANEGLLPRVSAGGSLLSEGERRILRDQFDVELAPDNEGALEREVLQIYSAFTAPTSQLYLCYRTGDGSETMTPSYLVSRVQKLFSIEPQAGIPETGYTVSSAAGSLLAAVEGQPELLAVLNRVAGDYAPLREAVAYARALAQPRKEAVSPGEARTLFGDPVYLSASKLDQLGNCPLGFFLQYGIGAKPLKEAGFDASQFGTFVHDILEHGVEALGSEPLEPDKSMEIVERFMEEYAEKRLSRVEQTPRDQYLFRRNGQEAALLLTEISQELGVSDFVPVAFELGFGDHKDVPAVDISGKMGEGKLTGYVDRADLYRSGQGDYLRVVDYKTGTKKFDYTDLYGGVGMQMLLYLFALSRRGISGITEHPIPAGVLYFPAKREFENQNDPEEAEYTVKKRSGVILSDPQLVEAMEHGDSGKFLPVKRTGKSYGDFAVTEEQMKLLSSFTEKRMGEAVDRILSGDFRAEPFYRGREHDPCSYCDYQAVCQNTAEFRRKHYHAPVKASEFWEKIGGEEDG